MGQNERRSRPGRNRLRAGTARTNRITIRVSDDELGEIEAAAAVAGLTPTGYAADAAVAAARARRTPHLDALRGAVLEVMAARSTVNRVGGNLNQAVAALNGTGQAPVWLRDVVELCGRTLSAVEEAMVRLRGAVSRPGR